MKNKFNPLMLIAAILLIGSYFFPIWSISLEAPQYPEGLGMYIYINKISGHKANDLQSINGLNHYIGMKQIKPDEIPELKIMPFFIGFMLIAGLLIAFFNKKALIFSWILLFAIAAIVGLYDFWKWEFDYGHNLDPRAIIKIPGMNYQPPLLGSKQLLNFNATSLPYVGAILIGLSVIIAIISFIKFKKIQNCNHFETN